MPVSKDGKFSYNILFEDSFADLPEAMADLELETHKICIVTDSNVGPLYAETVKAELERSAAYVKSSHSLQEKKIKIWRLCRNCIHS